MSGGRLRGQPAPSLSLFKNDPRIPINGVGRLPTTMSINSIDVEPDFIYCAGGGMASTSLWTPYRYGQALDQVVVATAPTVNAGSPYLGRLDDSVLFAASDYYEASNNTFADITTEDIVIELIFRKGTTVNARLIDKRIAAAGLTVYSTTGYINVRIGDGVDQATAAGTVTEGAIHHIIAFLDKSGSGIVYVDGEAGGSAVDLTDVGSLTVATPFTMGALSGGTNPYDERIMWAAQWKYPGWLDTHLQPTIARYRANLVQGVHPYMARGTATPTVQTRASVAHLDKYESDGTRRIYLIGSGALRLSDRIDSNGKRLKGYLPEAQITNLVIKSEEIDDVAWTKTRCSITNTSTTELPNGDTSVNDVIHEDATAANSHFIVSAANISFTADTKYVYSFWAKAINRSWVRPYLVNNGLGTSVYFDLSNGIVGTEQNIDESGIEDFGSGLYRCWFSWTHDATEDRNIYVMIGEGDDDATFDGLDQDSIYCWGLQIESGVDYPTSYMPTAGAAVIREEDSLRFNAADGNLGGTGSNKAGYFSARTLLPNYSVNPSAPLRLAALSDGGSSNDRWLFYYQIDSRPTGTVLADGGTARSAQAIVDGVDGVINTFELSWEPYHAVLTFNQVAGSTEVTLSDMPDQLDNLEVGCQNTLVQQLNGLIADIEFYDRVLRKVL